MGEFTTAVKYNMNITHILLNNSELGKISQEQWAGEWEVWQTSLLSVVVNLPKIRLMSLI